MIQAGSNIQSANDELTKVKVEYLYHSLRNPKPQVEAHIRRLRVVQSLDRKQYSLLKRQLPYVVCGIFNPPLRRTENFAYTEYFIVDIDHVGEKEMDISELRKRLECDSRVVLSFLSPGQDGLKLLFRLSERCYDAGLYTLFYKSFVKAFSTQYHLDQVIDGKTCDVARACFVSVDPDAYYNPDADVVDMNAYIDTSDPLQMFEQKHELDMETQQIPTEAEELHEKEPDDEAMIRIKQLLGVRQRAMQKPKVDVPDVPQIDAIMDGLVEYVQDQGIRFGSAVKIQYGKKLQFSLGLKKAEINLFFGKRGFSVVKSPKCGTSAELNELVAGLIQLYINEH